MNMCRPFTATAAAARALLGAVLRPLRKAAKLLALCLAVFNTWG